jgi:hypothetical protein
MRMESVTEGTPSLPFFKKKMQIELKINHLQNMQKYSLL